MCQILVGGKLTDRLIDPTVIENLKRSMLKCGEVDIRDVLYLFVILSSHLSHQNSTLFRRQEKGKGLMMESLFSAHHERKPS